jgi:hypothetical protein
MRRLPTMLASASAAALTTLAITVAVPAIADNAGGDTDGADTFAACLRDHGLAGAPDAASLKEWLGARLQRGDATAERATAVCAPKPTMATAVPGPSEKELRSCLTGHGVALPGGDGLALKRWLLAHGDDAANRDAMEACHMAPVGKPADGGACSKEGGVKTAIVAGRAGKPATAEPAGTDAQDLSSGN